MMKRPLRISGLIMLGLQCLAVKSVAEDAPLLVRLEKECAFSLHGQCMTWADRLSIASKSNELTITKIEANRGNCEVGGAPFPITLRFGDRTYYYLGCSPLEVTLHTDKGAWTFNWTR